MPERQSSHMVALRHTVATVAYRGAKALRGTPEGFESYCANPGSRTPVEILAHISDLFDWALSIAKGVEVWHDAVPQEWDKEVDRFFRTVGAFDEVLCAPSGIACSPELLFQGPIADALTHIGQIAMLRRMRGAPIRGESYFRAEIAVGRVGPAQAPPRREFD
jgi:hypothetical protein